MKALVADPSAEGHLAQREVAEPRPGSHEVVVAVEAVSLNRGEVKALATADDGWRPGWDVAGRVLERAADGTGPPEGTRVVGLVPGGGWAQRVAIATSLLAPVPDGLDAGLASTLPVAGLTARLALDTAGLHPGSRVLVTGATGGVGAFAVQIAAHMGADVTATVRSEEKARAIIGLGATRGSVGMPDDGEFDIILESVGGDSLSQATALVARNGMIVSFGNSSGSDVTFNPANLFGKNACLRGFVLFSELQRHGNGAEVLARLAQDLGAGHLRVELGFDGDWSFAAHATHMLMDRTLPGKAVLRVAD